MSGAIAWSRGAAGWGMEILDPQRLVMLGRRRVYPDDLLCSSVDRDKSSLELLDPDVHVGPWNETGRRAVFSVCLSVCRQLPQVLLLVHRWTCV
jgi:hypothetical protein